MWRLSKRVSYLQSRQYLNMLHRMKTRWNFKFYRISILKNHT
jgi:hypothetical protein